MQTKRLEEYETIPDEDGSASSALKAVCCHSECRLVMVVALVVIAWMGLEFMVPAPGNNTDSDVPPRLLPHHHEVIPTPLSIVDASSATLDYIYALDNPLYQDLENAELHGRKSSRHYLKQQHVQEFPAIFLDLDRERENDNGHATDRTSLTISWTDGVDHVGKGILKDDDIFVVQCSPDQKNWSIQEAATLAQVRATHQKHRTSVVSLKTSWFFHRNNNDNNNNHEWFKSNDDEWSSDPNEWYIPTVPSFLLRQPYCQFIIYQKHQPLEYYAVAESPVVQFGAVHKPTAVHLALTQNVDRLLVHFVTGGVGGTPLALFGTHHHDDDRLTTATPNNNNNNHTQLATGTTDTYTAADLCQPPANETGPGKFLSPGQLHTVALTGLEANTVYYYKVGLETEPGAVTWSSVYQFTTALPAGDRTDHTFLVYGDQGCPGVGWGPGSAWVAAMAERESDVRAIHHVGDLSYAQGAAHQWDAWFDMIQPVSAKIPLMIAVGNHEYDHDSGGGGSKDPSHVETEDGFRPAWGDFANDSGGECGVPTSKRFTMPATGNGVFWYSYDYGLVHIVVISSEHDLSIGSPQHVWLEQDFRSVNRSLTPWLIVESHRPLYEGEKDWNANSVGVAMRLEMEDLMHDYHVDVVIAGHFHAYHRTYVVASFLEDPSPFSPLRACAAHSFFYLAFPLALTSQLRWPLS